MNGPLAPYTARFAEELAGRGYAEWTIVEFVRVWAHLSRWMEATCRLGVGPGDVEEFCGVRREQGCTARVTPQSLSRMWEFLDGAGLLARLSTGLL